MFPPSRPWTEEEVDILQNHINKYPFRCKQTDLEKIAIELPSRSIGAISVKFLELRRALVYPHQRHWSDEEKIKLAKLYKEKGPRWKSIAKLLGTKTSRQCRDQFELTENETKRTIMSRMFESSERIKIMLGHYCFEFSIPGLQKIQSMLQQVESELFHQQQVNKLEPIQISKSYSEIQILSELQTLQNLPVIQNIMREFI